MCWKDHKNSHQHQIWLTSSDEEEGNAGYSHHDDLIALSHILRCRCSILELFCHQILKWFDVHLDEHKHYLPSNKIKRDRQSESETDVKERKRVRMCWKGHKNSHQHQIWLTPSDEEEGNAGYSPHHDLIALSHILQCRCSILEFVVRSWNDSMSIWMNTNTIYLLIK